MTPPELEAGYRLKAERKGWGSDWEDILPHILAEDFPNPCGRLATREEVAYLVLFLASEEAGFINGQNIRVDGGAVAYVQWQWGSPLSPLMEAVYLKPLDDAMDRAGIAYSILNRHYPNRLKEGPAYHSGLIIKWIR